MENKLTEKLISIYSLKRHTIYEFENYISIRWIGEDDYITVTKTNISELINILTEIINKEDGRKKL